MTEPFTLTMPIDLLAKAKFLADRAGRPVDAYLVETIERSLNPLAKAVSRTPPDQWTDEEVVNAADSMMPEAEDERLSDLLDRQREGLLLDKERGELDALMEFYHRMSLRKADGLAEAVRRGLREPIHP